MNPHHDLDDQTCAEIIFSMVWLCIRVALFFIFGFWIIGIMTDILAR